MPTVKIDGQVYEYDPDHHDKLLQFCLDQGVELPHFCYHPAMSIPANCRQCLVQVGTPERDRATGELVTNEDGDPNIQFMPGMQTSCTMGLQDGMVVKTHRSSDAVREAQKDTLEFLLINHPLDCPICDQAGHCPLQIQAYKYGPEGSRFEFRKVHKPKRVKLGPRVTMDAERCINCTRCTRFTDEISESGQLTISNRGVRNHPHYSARRGVRRQVLDEHNRHLPGRRAHGIGLPVQSAYLGDELVAFHCDHQRHRCQLRLLGAR